jgi:uncharacterized protein YjiS (DUF1127 family)
MLVQRSTRSASRIVGQHEVSGNEPDGRKTAFWSSVLDYVIESFALYAASFHPVALFPVERRLDPRDMPHSGQVFGPGRRGLLTLVSTTASPETSRRRPEPSTSPSPPAGYAIGLVGATQRELEIEKAVAALAKLDDRTLRDLGIPHRSLVERTVRYCRDC